MQRRIKCRHCGNLIEKNPRLKGKQLYCGAKACQQARKTAWERARMQNDADYKKKRQAQKKRWSKTHGHTYQAKYRKTHPDYQEKNQEQQRNRGKKERSTLTDSLKIVKTDALFFENLTCQGLYVLLLAKKTDTLKIVKTDALTMEIINIEDLIAILCSQIE